MTTDAAVHLILVEGTVLNLLVIRGQARRRASRRSSSASRLLLRLQVMVNLLVVQHLVKEVSLEVVSRASGNDVCSTGAVD